MFEVKHNKDFSQMEGAVKKLADLCDVAGSEKVIKEIAVWLLIDSHMSCVDVTEIFEKAGRHVKEDE